MKSNSLGLETMLRLFVFFGFCICDFYAAYTLEEYNERERTVNEMNGLYQNFIYSSVYDDQKRSSIQENFIKYCNTKFDNSEAWIMNALEDPKGSLVEDQLKSNKFNFDKTEIFMKTALDTAQMATRMGFWCSALMQNKAEATRLVDFQKAIETKIPELTQNLESQMQSIFETNVKTLVDKWVGANNFKDDEHTRVFMNISATTLRNEFQVGQWLTVAFPNSVAKKICGRPDAFSISVPAGSKWTFMVCLLKDGEKYDVQAVTDALWKIGLDQKEWSCTPEIDRILEEANYSCNSTQFTFFGVSEKVLFGTSDTNLFQTRHVRRASFTVICHFEVGIFA